MNQEQMSASGWKILLTRMLNHNILDISLVALGLAFTTYFLLAWLFLSSWVHFEFVRTAPAYLLKPGQSFFSNSLEYGFNLKITELGYYRPRFLGFFIQYIDTNLSFLLYKEYPQLGIKLPSYAFSIMTTVASFVWFWRSLFPKGGYGVALIGGASLLYYDVYMNTSFMVLRGGKFLTSAVGIFLMTIFIRYHRRHFQLSSFGSCFTISCVLFLLATMDEQITAVVFFIAFATLILGCIEKSVSQSVVIFVLAAANYCLYFVFWGRWLFAKFTPDGIQINRHPHNFSDALKVNLADVSSAVEMLLSNMIALGISSFIFLSVFVCSLAKIFRQGEDRPYKVLICTAFTLFPILLTSFMVASHPAIYNYKTNQLWSLFYLLFPVHALIATVAYSLHLADFKSDQYKIALAIAFILICTIGVYKMENLYQISCISTSKILDSFTCGENPVFLLN